MSEPTIRPVADTEQLSLAAAEEFVRLGRAAVAARGRFTVVLSGGSTPRRLYQLLAEAPFRDQVHWPRVEFFWGDERTVPPDHEDSNYRMAREAFLQRLDIPDARSHRLQAERADVDIAARDYQAEIARVFGVSPSAEPPAFDLILLGMGADGHTASLFPHTAALKEVARWVVPNHVPKLSTYRLTMTPVILNRGSEILFLVAGTDKAGPLAEIIEGRPDPDRLPAQLIRPVNGRLVWLVDQGAASQLKLVTPAGPASERR
jgi:6-phosphogluconolactonase